MSGADGVFSIHFMRTLTPNRVQAVWRSEPPALPIEMQRQIDTFWDSLPKDFIFNGALARLENWRLDDDALTISLQSSDYRTLLFSNRHVELIRQRWGDGCLSRALGISAVLVSCDGRLVFVRRSMAVGEFPGAFDVFGGHIDAPTDGSPDIFAAMAKELQEEAGLWPDELDLTLIGMIESTPNLKPELIFSAKTFLTETEIKKRVRCARDRGEFSDLFTAPNERQALALLQTEKEKWSPSAYGSICVYLKTVCRNEKESAHES